VFVTIGLWCALGDLYILNDIVSDLILTLGSLRGGYIAQEEINLLGCLNGDIGSTCGTEFLCASSCCSCSSYLAYYLLRFDLLVCEV
jgi:hypothetical protein